MKILKTDTLYFRADHPVGMLFEAGQPAPAAKDGWVAKASDIAPLATAYEHTSLASFD